MLYLQFRSSAFDEATDDLLHPLGVPHVDGALVKLGHLEAGRDAGCYIRVTYRARRLEAAGGGASSITGSVGQTCGFI